jgi:hypothetical protein
MRFKIEWGEFGPQIVFQLSHRLSNEIYPLIAFNKGLTPMKPMINTGVFYISRLSNVRKVFTSPISVRRL